MDNPLQIFILLISILKRNCCLFNYVISEILGLVCHPFINLPVQIILSAVLLNLLTWGWEERKGALLSKLSFFLVWLLAEHKCSASFLRGCFSFSPVEGCFASLIDHLIRHQHQMLSSCFVFFVFFFASLLKHR